MPRFRTPSRGRTTSRLPAAGDDGLMASPLPLLVVRRGTTGERALGALPDDARVEIIRAVERKTDWVSTAQRAAAVVVTTNTDPLSALLYVLTAGITVPILVAASRQFKHRKREVLRAGAAACFPTPINRVDVNKIVKLLTLRSSGMRVDGTLRLVLDPVARVARLRARSVHLSPREFAVLHCLTNRSGRPVSAVELLSYVWANRPSREQTRQILEVYIFSLRKKLRQVGLSGAIRTVRGYGYALAPAEQKARR